MCYAKPLLTTPFGKLMLSFSLPLTKKFRSCSGKSVTLNFGIRAKTGAFSSIFSWLSFVYSYVAVMRMQFRKYLALSFFLLSLL